MCIIVSVITQSNHCHRKVVIHYLQISVVCHYENKKHIFINGTHQDCTCIILYPNDFIFSLLVKFHHFDKKIIPHDIENYLSINSIIHLSIDDGCIIRWKNNEKL